MPENNDEKRDGQFQYSYAAPTENERKEIEDIRRQYTPAGEKSGKLEQLKMLDRHVKRTSNAVALSIGVVGTLGFGLGMAMTIEWELFAAGIAVSIVGSAIGALSFPIYKKVLKYMKKKYAAEILRRSNELLNEKNGDS